jgi:gamma-glutamylcysteine synthetase
MKQFYQDISSDAMEILDFEEAKFIDPEMRYAWQIRKQYADGFVKGGLALAKEYQKLALTPGQ